MYLNRVLIMEKEVKGVSILHLKIWTNLTTRLLLIRLVVIVIQTLETTLDFLQKIYLMVNGFFHLQTKIQLLFPRLDLLRNQIVKPEKETIANKKVYQSFYFQKSYTASFTVAKSSVYVISLMKVPTIQLLRNALSNAASVKSLTHERAP